MGDTLSKLGNNAMIATMSLNIRYVFMMLICLLSVSCVKNSMQATDELWKQWRAIDDLVQVDYPDAPAVILVHGWNGSEFTWSDIEALRRFEQNSERIPHPLGWG